MSSERLSHKERLQAVLKGEKPDRIPVAFWRHWPVDDQDSEMLCHVTLEYQKKFDMDWIKLTPSSSYTVTDWGAKHEYRGKAIGERDYTEEVSLLSLASFILRSGWPGSLQLATEDAIKIPLHYLDNVITNDVAKVDDKIRDEAKMRLLLRSLARNESTTATMAHLKSDMKGVDQLTIDESTIADYLNIFEKLFIIENQKPFAVALRSSLRIKQAEKRHFTDPSFACSLLGITTEQRLIGDLRTFGFLFEALCERDLRIYANSFGANLLHYQDYNNDEIDAVVELPDGRWSAFEIKLGANQIDEAATKLLKINKKFSHPATTLCVICGLSNAAYKRSDGVYVVPITALKP
jgi:predicted AAA+ superfamily ATPase